MGSLYSELKKERKMALLYNGLFVLRRLMFAYMAVFLGNYPFLQIQGLAIQSISILMYLSYTKPFKDKLSNILEMFNEICILILSYHLFYFTDYVEDPLLKY